MQSNNDEVQSIINKIDKEITEVRTHITDAKYNTQIGNYDIAKKHLQEAKKISTCSYCQQKIDFFLANLDYSSNICNIKHKTCNETKENIISEMQQFIEKLPSVSEIKRNKSINSSSSQDFDIIGNVAKTFDEMGKNMGKMWESIFKM